MSNKKARIGFISTRLAGTDGVSLETVKWSNVLVGLGHEYFYFAGQSNWPAESSYVVPEAHFDHPLIRKLTTDLFDDHIRSSETSERIRELHNHLKKHLHQFVRKFELNLVIREIS
jgi:hypothetical protein